MIYSASLKISYKYYAHLVKTLKTEECLTVNVFVISYYLENGCTNAGIF